MKRGLTLGKFAPLHKGHQYLIETAISEMDEVILLIYDCPETTRIPLSVRAQWIRALYPDIRVIEAWDGPVDVGDTHTIRKQHEDYILDRLQIQGITHFYSSEFYGEHMSRALCAVNRLVDRARSTVPVSARRIRETPFELRHYLHPLVYRDLVVNIVFLGAPSTGKTTIAQRMADDFNTAWMPEYGREYWELNQKGRRLTLDQLAEIAEGHLEREESLLYQANRFLFTDTNALSTYVFSLVYHGVTAPRLAELAAQAAARYDLVFLCDADIPCEDSWDRSGDVSRQVFQRRQLTDLLERKIPFFTLRGGLESRVEQVRNILARYEKYTNVLDLLGEPKSERGPLTQ
jgi:NadR type nicotinamide-nucleotide adenylyltransferase